MAVCGLDKHPINVQVVLARPLVPVEGHPRGAGAAPWAFLWFFFVRPVLVIVHRAI